MQISSLPPSNWCTFWILSQAMPRHLLGLSPTSTVKVLTLARLWCHVLGLSLNHLYVTVISGEAILSHFQGLSLCQILRDWPLYSSWRLPPTERSRSVIAGLTLNPVLSPSKIEELFCLRHLLFWLCALHNPQHLHLRTLGSSHLPGEHRGDVGPGGVPLCRHAESMAVLPSALYLGAYGEWGLSRQPPPPPSYY